MYTFNQREKGMMMVMYTYETFIPIEVREVKHKNFSAIVYMRWKNCYVSI